MKGNLIVIEGVDGSGKSTQVKLLAADHKLAFPRYDRFFGKIIKIILQHQWGREINPYWVSFLFALDRLMAKSTINNWLKTGKTVLLDRYTGSSQAHQGAKLKGRQRQKLITWIGWLENKLFKLPQPNKVIFLSVPPRTTTSLIKARGRLADEAEKDLEYQQQSFQVYKHLAKIYYWEVIDCLDKNKLLSKYAINRKIKTAIG